jgi:hypothetical protein
MCATLSGNQNKTLTAKQNHETDKQHIEEFSTRTCSVRSWNGHPGSVPLAVDHKYLV